MANKYTFVWKGSVEKNKAELIAKVDGILKEAEAVLDEENSSEPQEDITKEDLEKRTERIIEKMEKEGVTDKKLRKAVTLQSCQLFEMSIAWNVLQRQMQQKNHRGES